MESKRMQMIAELIKHLESMDADELQGKMNPVAEVEIEAGPVEEVADLDPDKTKNFEMGFKKKLGVPSAPTPGPMDKLAEAAGDMGAEGDDMADDELEEREKFLA